ncbi:MAG TPA: maleylpyruvate isomerase family mycothiol-dependent enzyme [Streptosporangiaceae bacterium]|nr:maleylpyruvate isomerase family mycothiol-dependent enzyme [Streptosporangiaceae bacterium]
MSEWNAMTYEGKDTILRVVRHEADQMFTLAGEPGAWDAPTACENWRVKDIIGHIVDTTEGYFRSFEFARSGTDAPTPHGLLVMHELAGDSARSFGSLSQQDMLARARADLDTMMSILEPLTAEEWGGFIVPHAYMGPVPAFVYAGGQLMDYGVHTWDIRQGSGQAHALSADAADLLVPFMFIIWQSTIRPDADLSPFSIGIRVSGRNAGDTRVSIGDGGMTYEPGDISDLPAFLEFDPGSMVLTAFGRLNGGTAYGDQALANRFLNLFYRI